MKKITDVLAVAGGLLLAVNTDCKDNMKSKKMQAWLLVQSSSYSGKIEKKSHMLED